MTTTPTIHLNGTSQDELVRQYTAALEAIWHAQEAIMAMAPNGRDYYPQGDAAFPAARREHLDRLQTLQRLYEEIENLALRVAQPDEDAVAVLWHGPGVAVDDGGR